MQDIYTPTAYIIIVGQHSLACGICSIDEFVYYFLVAEGVGVTGGTIGAVGTIGFEVRGVCCGEDATCEKLLL